MKTRQGKVEEAEAIYDKIMNMKGKDRLDVALLACVANNQVAIREEGMRDFYFTNGSVSQLVSPGLDLQR